MDEEVLWNRKSNAGKFIQGPRSHQRTEPLPVSPVTGRTLVVVVHTFKSGKLQKCCAAVCFVFWLICTNPGLHSVRDTSSPESVVELLDKIFCLCCVLDNSSRPGQMISSCRCHIGQRQLSFIKQAVFMWPSMVCKGKGDVALMGWSCDAAQPWTLIYKRPSFLHRAPGIWAECFCDGSGLIHPQKPFPT